MSTLTVPAPFELLIACAQPSIDEPTSARIQALLNPNLHWDKFTALALTHGLSPLVYTRLEPFLPRPLPKSVAKLRDDAVRLTQHSLVHVGEMKRLVPYLEQHGIETIVFKGPALAQSLYARVALRPFMDLDLWVQPHALSKAWSLLTAQGYALTYDMSPAQLPEAMKAGNHLPLYGTNNECVELHWTLFAKSRATFFDTAGAWSRRVPLQIQDLTVMTLAPRDLVHYLCLHGTKHVWCRLAWLTDLVWFIHRYPEFEWNELLEEAHRSGTQRMLLVGLSLAHELFNTPLDASVLQRIQADKQVLPLAQWMWQRILDGNQDLPTGRELVRLVLRTRERPRDRGRDLYHHFMTLRPNNLQDASHAALAPATYPLHRLWYLVRKYGRARPQRV